MCAFACVATCVFWHQLLMRKLYPHPGAWYVNLALMLIAPHIGLNECVCVCETLQEFGFAEVTVTDVGVFICA